MGVSQSTFCRCVKKYLKLPSYRGGFGPYKLLQAARATWAPFGDFRYFLVFVLPSGKKQISLPHFSLLGSKIDSHGRKLWAFQLRSKIYIIPKKKKKSSAHSFSPFALMIDPSKENWGSAVYFLFLCEKIPKITELQQVKGGEKHKLALWRLFLA